MNLIDRLRRSNGAATNSIMLTFVQVITTVLGLIVTKLLSVHFSLQEYGTYSQALLVTTTVTSLSILGLTNATNYFYNRTKDEQQQRIYVATIFSLQYIVGVGCGVLVLVLRTPISRYFGNDALIGILPIVAFTPLFTNLIQMYQTQFVSIGKAKVIALRNLVVSIIRLIAVVVACYVLYNIITVLFVILCLDIAQIIYLYFLFKRYKNPIAIKDSRFNLTREILAFSIPMSIYVLTNSLSRDIDKYVISAFANTETLAIYTNAAKVLPFDMLTASLITVLVPIVTRLINQQKYDEAKNVFKLYLRIGYVLTFIFVGGAIAVSKDLMRFLYAEKFLVGLPVFIVYLFVDMIRFANVTTILSGAGKTKTLMTVSVVTMLCNAVFNVLGYKLIGMLGPALVTLILTACMTLALLHVGSKEIKTRIVDLFDFKELGIICLEICIVGTLIYFLSSFMRARSVSYVVSLITCYGIYIVILITLNYKRAIQCYRQLNQYKG
ncbi:hypothetical protein SDC9_88992 [bioreactor metagenome]|uniref:Uncharacterized protein n=1 Tax=bioreactor metagenome TaxID=1076179 RepID=A0A644ZNM5_9ZZZZ